ncbi:MAG TPA: ROK family protein [Solirubrobacteraceae bacterium]|jgi:glucokinase|nr:ROK family protein [Solirubrobacteraceae bacterium]
MPIDDRIDARAERRAAGHRGGVDLGGTKIQTVVVDADNAVLAEARRPTPTRGGPADVAVAIAAAMREAAAAAGVRTSDLGHVGVGSPGAIDAGAGTVASASNLPGWANVTYALAPALSAALDTAVVLGNDVQVATDAEAQLGAGRDHRSILGVFWGTGVGGGIVLDGKPWLGQGAAGEIGHVCVQMRDGLRCSCGRSGCMEAYAGRGAMERRARELHEGGAHTELFKIARKRGRERLTSGIWAAALERKDPLARKLVGEAVEALGAGVASVVNVLDVEAVILGGGLGVRLGKPYADRIAAAMLPHLFNDDRPPAVLVAALGDLGGAIGASLLAPVVAATA